MLRILITNRIVLLIVLLLVALFVLPDSIIGGVPYAQNVRNYLEDTFSQLFHNLKIWYQKLLIWIGDAANRVKDALDTAQETTQTFTKERLDALSDVIDGLNRLFNRTNGG